MKKKLFFCALVLIFLFGFAASAMAATPTIYVDGKQVSFDTAPVIINGTTLAPMRAIFEAIGAEVDWDNDTRTAIGTKDGDTVSVPIGSSSGYKNGEAIPLLQPAQLINNRTMVPLRFISESLNCTVGWDGNTKTITIVTKDFLPQGVVGPFRVTRVIDGDTFEIDYNGITERVRLIGVDTPESVHPNQDKNVAFGKVASDYTAAALNGRDVFLEFDTEQRDQYGRLLAYIYLDGEMFNKTLLENGMAVVATYPPNVKYVEDFTALQAAARTNGIGVWEGYAEDNSSEDSSDTGNGNADANNNTGTVYYTKSGSKYHYANPCGRGTYYPTTLTDALARGLEPCAKCVL